MEFAPSTTIRLYNVNFDNTYKNVVYFKNEIEREIYFANDSPRFVRQFTEYYTVRMTGSDGSPRTSVKVDMGIEEFNSKPANYMIYQNHNLGGKWIHAFITQVKYISEGVTELVIETDVFQTWFWDVTILPSYVEREHSLTDEAGENIIPESFKPSEFNYNLLTLYQNDPFGYLVTATEQLGDDMYRGCYHSGIYQGLYFYFYKTRSDLNIALNDLENEGGECVVSITAIPYSNLIETNIMEYDVESDGTINYEVQETGFIKESFFPASLKFNVYKWVYSNSKFIYDHQEYKPKNNKLYTYPFYCITVNNHTGSEGEYRIEDFKVRDGYTYREIVFEMKGDISPNPTRCIYPNNYKGMENNYDAGLQSAQFPQCAFNSDTYKLWLAKNQYGQELSQTQAEISGISSALSLNFMGVVSAGVQMQQIANEEYKASREPNRMTVGNTNNNLLTAISKNTFDFYVRTLRKDQAEAIDNYFTMFGYQTNKVKTPNLSSRPHFNYVKTIDVNIIGAIPQDELNRFKDIFNKGVTLWKPESVIGNYTVDNSPVKE